MRALFLIVLRFLREMFTNKNSIGEKELKNADILAKYVFKSDELRSDGRPRPSAMKPRQNEALSVSEVSGLAHQDVCEHGRNYVDNPGKGRVHIGYVNFAYVSVVRVGLSAVYDNDPPRHVSVVFPESPERRREAAKALADEVVILNKCSHKKFFAQCI